jgi:hypothetical protein
MRTYPGPRTLDLWSTFLRFTGMDPLARLAAGTAALAASPARRRAPVEPPESTPAAPQPAGTGAPDRDEAAAAEEAHRELRMRLVEEYLRRLEVVAAVLSPLRDAWSVEAVARAERLSADLAAWNGYLHASEGGGAGEEPSPDLQALGAEVLDLVSRASTHLAWSDPAAGTG